MSEEPRLDRSITLRFVGDWGQANFHRICAFLTQEFCDRAGPRSRVATWSIRNGGIESIYAVGEGEVDLCIATPAMIMGDALTGEGIFAGRALPDLRAIAVLPQNDRLVLAVDRVFGISSFADLREKRPPLRIAASTDDGTNYIGWVTRRYMEAHGIDEATLNSWGGGYVTAHRPEQTVAIIERGDADALCQEAIMTPWWRGVMENSERPMAALPAEPAALDQLKQSFGFRRNSLPAGYWNSLDQQIDTLDFSDFVLFVRSDMNEDVAHLLTWCIVEQRAQLERQYKHLPPERSPLSYPLEPAKMCQTPVPLHDGARRYYKEAGLL